MIGGIWLMWLLGFHLAVASVVGLIALAGIAAETGVMMLLYIDHAYAAGGAELELAIITGAVDRIRPKIMTVMAIMAGLLTVLWSEGAGADVMQRIAVPMIGGMVTSALLTLIVLPAVYALVKQGRLR
jgi:copper/silver efflux system protein